MHTSIGTRYEDVRGTGHGDIVILLLSPLGILWAGLESQGTQDLSVRLFLCVQDTLREIRVHGCLSIQLWCWLDHCSMANRT